MKKIVILGGGYGGVYAGKKLHKLFKKDESVTITLIDKNPFHTLMTELHEVAGHRTEPDAIQVELKKIFAGRKVDVVLDKIVNIDFKEQVLKGENHEYEYDYLVLGAGSEPHYFGVEGAEEHAFTLWSYEDAINLREHIEDMFRRASVEHDPEIRQRYLTFAVCGGGFTGVEMAGEIGEAKYHLAEKYDVNVNEVKIYNIEAMDRILNMLQKEKQIKKVEKRYEKLGIELLKNAPITEVTKTSITLKSGTKIPTYTLIWAAGIQSCTFARNLGMTVGKQCRIQTNEYMQSVDHDNVFIVGDSCAYEDEDGYLPQIVEAAEGSAHTAAVNIYNLIEGKELETHKQKYHGFMVSVGSRYGVSDTAGIRFSGWMAILVKHFVNFYYLFKTGGLRALWNYLRHEFFHVRHNRSFLGGHFSNASPNAWLMPLRTFLGVMWLIEGIKKINEGWLKEAMIFASTAADSGASAAWEEGGEVVEEVVTYGEPLIKEVPGFMQWIIDNLIAPIAVPVQTVMVVGEIVIGLCLIAGLFTFIASIVSVGMTVGITLTGMADASILWYFFAGIAMIGGAGRALGLDYYAMPIIKKFWKKTGFARKSYLYFD